MLNIKNAIINRVDTYLFSALIYDAEKSLRLLMKNVNCIVSFCIVLLFTEGLINSFIYLSKIFSDFAV